MEIEKINKKLEKRIINKIKILYGNFESGKIYKELEDILILYRKKLKHKRFQRKRFSQKDIVLISYGDSIQDSKNLSSPIQSLGNFAKKRLKNIVSTIHILPFYPSSSDRGFAVLDYEKVDSNLGTWEDILKIGEDFELMSDFVCNHISSKSDWFKEYIAGNEKYKDFFITFDNNNKPNEEDLSKVFRPRISKLLLKFDTFYGKRFVWKTFSHDQIDLNYSNYKVFLRMVEVVLYYVNKNISMLRFDAVGYVWKEIGTSCFLTKKSHIFVQLFRDILDFVNPYVSIVAELNTGIAYESAFTYFGNGKNEAQMVYNFSLAPLVLHTFYNQDATKILNCVSHLERKYSQFGMTLFNFLDCHDGIGVLEIEKMIGESSKNKLLKNIKLRKGKISYRRCENKKNGLYEFNITWWSAIDSKNKNENINFKIKRYIASRAISFSISGIPAIYLIGLFGIENYLEGVRETGYKRDINRVNLTEDEIDGFFAQKTKEFYVFEELLNLVKIRRREKAFHPKSKQRVLNLNKKIFSLLRMSPNKKEKVLILINISDRKINLKINCIKHKIKTRSKFIDLISKEKFSVKNNLLFLSLEPYRTMWIKINA